MQQNIHLGLDLKGGSHLVLQVQVQDAAKTEADQTIENLRDATRTANIIVAGYDRNDPQTLQDTDSIQVNIHGVDQAKTQAVPQPGRRQVSRLDSDARQRDRLQDEHEAERADRSQAQHGGAGAGHDRAPRQRSRADRADRAGLRGFGQRSRRFWWNCRASTIPRA